MGFKNGMGMTSDILSRIRPRDDQEQLLMDVAYAGFKAMEALYYIPPRGCLEDDPYRPHFHCAAYDCKCEMEKLAMRFMESHGGILEFMKLAPAESIFQDPRVAAAEVAKAEKETERGANSRTAGTLLGHP